MNYKFSYFLLKLNNLYYPLIVYIQLKRVLFPLPAILPSSSSRSCPLPFLLITPAAGFSPVLRKHSATWRGRKKRRESLPCTFPYDYAENVIKQANIIFNLLLLAAHASST